MDKAQNLSANENREETKVPEYHQERPKTEEELIEELTQLFETMFKQDNFRKNKYLINRSNPYLEIPVKFIYDENGVRSKTMDRNIINKALNKCSQVSLINNEYVKLKHTAIRNKLIVKGIEKIDEDDFRRLAESLISKDEIKVINYDPKFSIVYITLADDAGAQKLLHSLSEKKFREKNIDSAFHEENLYISMMQDIQAQRPRQPYIPPQFQGPYGPMFSQGPFYMNPMMNPYMGYPQNPGYRGGYNNYGGFERKPFSKGPPDMSGAGRQYNKYRAPGPDPSQPTPQQQGNQPIPTGEPQALPQQIPGQQLLSQQGKKPYTKKPYQQARRPYNPNYPSYTNYNPGFNQPFNPTYNQNQNGGRYNKYKKGPKEEVVNDEKNFPPLHPDS